MAWSKVGKLIEKPLSFALCKIYSVGEENYCAKLQSKIIDVKSADFEREIDFYLLNEGNEYKCEVKLMGKGNPESADAVIARDSKVFIADKLSDTNKKQLNSLGVLWVELRSDEGISHFEKVLRELRIVYKARITSKENLDKIIDEVLG